MKELNAGDWVTIYEDPITEQHPEGTAQLNECVSVMWDGLERWEVRFDGDPSDELYPRTIKR